MKDSLGKKVFTEKPLRCLCDTGTTDSIMVRDSMAQYKNIHYKKQETVWSTAGGNYTTSETASVDFKLPDFSESREIQWNFHISNEKNNDNLGYDVIIGRDLMKELGMIIDFENCQVKWKELSIPMRNYGELEKGDELNLTFLQSVEPEVTQQLENRAQRIADAKHEKINVADYVSEQSHLSLEETNDLFNSLIKCQDTSFSEGLGCAEGPPVSIELKPGEENDPAHSRPFRILHVHLETLKKEIS